MMNNEDSQTIQQVSVFAKNSRDYGIQQVIDLLAAVPKSQDVFFAADMIKKTLGSMGISVRDILEDAIEKEELATSTVHRLDAEIGDYMARIDHLRKQIQHLQHELASIKDTKRSLITNDPSLSSYIDQSDKNSVSTQHVQHAPTVATVKQPAPVIPSAKIDPKKSDVVEMKTVLEQPTAHSFAPAVSASSQNVPLPPQLNKSVNSSTEVLSSSAAKSETKVVSAPALDIPKKIDEPKKPEFVQSVAKPFHAPSKDSSIKESSSSKSMNDMPPPDEIDIEAIFDDDE
ncbi:MAG: hypothetical protein V4629_00475 [Pseudomonadota bacterium]